MLDSFRKRDNLRPGQAATPAARPGAPNPAPGTGPSGPGVPNRVEPASVRPVSPEPAPQPAVQPSVVPVEPAPAEAAGASPRPEPGPSVARLTVGPDIKLKGAEITDCDTLIVEGQVDASMDSRVVEIAESGIFRGKVNVDVAEIRGRFEGELTAHKNLVVRETGRVSGTIRYGRIRIDEGGIVSGDVASTEAADGLGSGGTRAPDVRK